MHILLTAGPTREPLDPVRYLSNRSSGKMGYALAHAALAAGHAVTLVTGPVCLSTSSRRNHDPRHHRRRDVRRHTFLGRHC